MDIQQLNQYFGLEDQIEIVEGKGGFPVIAVSNVKAKAKISIYGGQVLSFQPEGEDELLFVSENAYFQEGKATKGGIPICWPWFGPDPENKGRASHGFVRNRMWKLMSTATTTDGETKVRLGISDSEETREIWPYSFELVIDIVIGSQLTVTLITQNKSEEAFTITQALHTYLSVGDINKVKVFGLEETAYLDKPDGGARKTQPGEIVVTEEVDRIYTDVKPEIIVEDGEKGRRIRVSSTGSRTAIVWNPWVEISKQMADLAELDYQRFICVETANAANEVVEVAAGEEYRLQAVYSIERS